MLEGDYDGVDMPPLDGSSDLPNFSVKDEGDSTIILEAGTVYLLLQQNIPVSRTLRLQWLLNNIHKTITVSRKASTKEILSSDDLEIISIIPFDSYSGYSNCYQVTCNTKVIFLAQSYRFVYCLDMSPSQSSVDIQTGEILFDEVISCFKKTLDGLCRPFIIPRNALVWKPVMYLTVIAHTPFFMTPAQQVLIKGVQVSLSNIKDIFHSVESQLRLLVQRIAHVSAVAHDEMDLQKVENERIVGALFEEQVENEHQPPNIAMVSPDANFVNMLRYSMLALSLLPENSLSHILVITDGVVAMPDVNIMESFMLQQHYDSIAVSFLKVGSTFHPHSSAGYVSYIDLLNFLAKATKGRCIGRFPQIPQNADMRMNIYHEYFLLWTFHSNNKLASLSYYLSESSEWLSCNSSFHGQKVPTLLLKKQMEDKMNVNPNILLARRMREGYTVDVIRHMGDKLYVQLSLQWKTHIFIQYCLTTQWPAVQNCVHFEVHISAPYEFLHDITCLVKKEQKSGYRQSVIERFLIRLTQLSTGDTQLAQHLSSFQNTSWWFSLPESVKNRVPVFILNNNDSSKPNLTVSDVSCPKFTCLWQPICQMDTSNWRKWFHTHKLSLILKHDHPLPRHLHLTNSSGRFQIVQCRQAAAALYGMLSSWASFVLIESHSYIKFLYKEDEKPAVWFCIIRVTSKLPCAVLNIGFSTETPGNVRHQVCEDLKAELSQLLYLSSPFKSKQNTCCILLHKPLEKIHVRYERMPSDFSTVVFPDGTQPPNAHHSLPHSPIAGTLFTTLSRYLYHNRWIWSASYPPNPRLGLAAISRILNTVTKMRIKEGFSFAHSSSGIINMVLEVEMRPKSDGDSLSCIIQYVLFPPHSCVRNEFRDTASGSEDETEAETELESELQMVTEVWIEPQCGYVVPSHSVRAYMDNKTYYELSDAIRGVDMKCINTLLTLEHLSLMCQFKDTLDITLDQSMSTRKPSTDGKYRKNSVRRDSNFSLSGNHQEEKNFKLRVEFAPFIDERIFHIPFMFNPIDLLPICSQTELLFSMFYESNVKGHKAQEKEHSNKLLLESFQEHLLKLHDKELCLKVEDCQYFTSLLSSRFTDADFHSCPIHQHQSFSETETTSRYVPLWRCFIKGISVTHVILSLVPATLYDLKHLVQYDNWTKQNSNCQSPEVTPTPSNSPRTSTRNSCYSDIDSCAQNSNCLVLPVYVYDCPLAVLIESYVNPTSGQFLEDVYEDHRYRVGAYIDDDVVHLKSEQLSSPESNSDNNCSEHKSCAKLHCKSLVLAHSKCFVTSLFKSLHATDFVHSVDVQFAVDQCEETVVDIDITDYMRTICGHLKASSADNQHLSCINNPSACQDLKPFHRLIKEKFALMTSVAFVQIPTNRDFYFCAKTFSSYKCVEVDADSDDNVSIPHSEDVEFRSERDVSLSSETAPPTLFHTLSNATSDLLQEDVSPLFLHLTCSVKYNENVINTPVNLLPTCLGEILQNDDLSSETFDRSKLMQITLDILCLTLPYDVQTVINEFSCKGLRTTSYCSVSSFQPSSVSSEGSSFEVQEFAPGGLNHLPEIQQRAIWTLEEEIKWLLKDEIATSLLDSVPVTNETLTFVIKHVTKSIKRSSCCMDIVDLNFVYGPKQSHDKFLQEFRQTSIRNYKLCLEDDIFYLAKDVQEEPPGGHIDLADNFEMNAEIALNSGETSSQQSDVSSIVGSILGTEGGYEEDVSEDEDGFEWLIQLDRKRKLLPNFWLIMKVDQDVVTIYFHCRFLELQTAQVKVYLKVQKAVISAIRDLCKRVNQSLLLQDLHDTRICDRLLEPDDDVLDIWHSDSTTPTITRNASFARLKSMDELIDGNDSHPTALLEASLKFMPGYFSCPVVWEAHFLLHPRLKTGSGKTCLSRGIVALKTVLNKLSVSNRSNMFVYQDSATNVFYLRLHENLQSCIKHMPRSEFEHAVVSRSPSIASLPLGHARTQPEVHSIGSISSGSQTEIRPRVQSIGERDVAEDTIILKVHGITEAGPDVKCELVQVLQNRLDDAVLESLSVMLARNSMCKLTPEDVHFLQKPFRPPEITFRLTIQEHAQIYSNSFIHYLRQNLLQFLNIPKYTDSRSHFHFKDYSESDQNNKVAEENVFIYNQSQNSGSRGIACIALAIICNKANERQTFQYKQMAIDDNLKKLVSTVEIVEEALPDVYLEFRIWKQGRVNVETLQHKLSAAVTHSKWDLIMEYHFLQYSLCTESNTLSMGGGVDDDVDTATQSKAREQFVPILLNTTVNCNALMSTKSINAAKMSIAAKPRNKRSAKKIVIPNSKAVQRLKFDDTTHCNSNSNSQVQEYDSSEYQIDSLVVQDIQMDPYELGKKGNLHLNYSELLPQWFEFGVEMGVAAAKKHSVNVTSRHNINVCLQELHHIIPQCSVDTVIRVFTAKPTVLRNGDVHETFIPHEGTQIPQKCLLIGRNFYQWKASDTDNATMEYVEMLTPFSKNEQRFMPTFTQVNFTPRQIFLYAVIQCDQLDIYLYNWSKDATDKLLTHCTNLGLWLSRRGAVLHSFTAQKLGLFHNQLLDRKELQMANNPYELESLVKFPNTFVSTKDWGARKPITSIPLIQLSPTEIFRDSKNPKTTKVPRSRNTDPIQVFTQEMQEVKKMEKRLLEEQKKLYGMWQSRATPGTCLAVEMIDLLNQHARVIHYCHTPLLFLPSWRIQSAATRDHSLSPPPPPEDDDALESASQNQPSEEKHWHQVLCTEFINEYKKYLQRLGFVPLQLESSPKKLAKNYEFLQSNGICYIQKSMLGGILIFTIQLNEPFFTTKLHAIECNRLPSKLSRALINQFTLSFLDECDRIKIHMHLHSFTYDFHLRLIHNYIANKPAVPISSRYHLTHFLDDFLKYYSKAPNFARNLVHKDTLTIEDLCTEGKQLYSYLLSNVKQYNMEVFEMKEDPYDEEENYVLVQVSNTPQVSYKDSQDRQHTDDFNVTLIIWHLCSPWDPSDKVLHLRYYLILTSQHKILPKTDNERKLGKFRTVYSIGRSISQLSQDKSLQDISTELSANIEIACKNENATQDDCIFDSIMNRLEDGEPMEKCEELDNSGVEDRPTSQTTSHTHSHGEIRQESVNYLGYYSSHEQLMQQLILDQAKSARDQIKEMVAKGMVHCRTSLLWNKLISCHEHLTFAEFTELRQFAKLENLCQLRQNFASLLNKPCQWYQGLWKSLLNRYSDQHRVFQSPDANLQHLVVLHPRYKKAFMMLSIDVRLSRGMKRCRIGRGMLNTLINKLPIELHVPGYQFCGPGTKLRKRLQRVDKGINPLDAACREHDIAYSRNKNLEERHRADKILSNAAKVRIKSGDSSFGEKTAAWLISKGMDAKIKMGMGVSKQKTKKKTNKSKKKKNHVILNN